MNKGNIEAIRVGCTYANKRLVDCIPKHQLKNSNNKYKNELKLHYITQVVAI